MRRGSDATRPDPDPATRESFRSLPILIRNRGPSEGGGGGWAEAK